MMTEEDLYARLKEALRDAIARHHLDACSISLKSRGLTPEEAIGRTARTDYPILNGREVMLQARFGEALGQAFTSAPVDFEGSLADVGIAVVVLVSWLVRVSLRARKRLQERNLQSGRVPRA